MTLLYACVLCDTHPTCRARNDHVSCNFAQIGLIGVCVRTYCVYVCVYPKLQVTYARFLRPSVCMDTYVRVCKSICQAHVFPTHACMHICVVHRKKLGHWQLLDLKALMCTDTCMSKTPTATKPHNVSQCFHPITIL